MPRPLDRPDAAKVYRLLLELPRRDSLTPRLAALTTALVGLVNVASALTPDIHWRGRLVLALEPVEAVRVFHAFALPAGTALLLVSPYLLRRRRRAWQVAVGLMALLGALDLLKGLDFEECLLSWMAAALLLGRRAAFTVRHEPLTLRSASWRVPALAAVALAGAAVDSWLGAGRAWVPLGVHLLQLGALLAIAYVVFRPLAGPSGPPTPELRLAAARLVRAHGSDTLSFFKLRSDKHYLFSTDGQAFVGYRIENGVLLLSGDPVGPEDAIEPLLREVRAFAQERGLRLGGVGASERLRPLHQRMGLRTLYLGDEAILDLERFSLEGRPIRKVRQSVHRLAKAGYRAELLEVDSLPPDVQGEAEQVLERGRQGAPERGFSMAMDSLRGPHEADTLVLLARDGDGGIRGVLHFVPCYGRAAMSLSFMRRDPATPNGLTEFMVVCAARLLQERGVGELSLNFACFARWLSDPANPAERVLGRLVALGNRFFQIESLYRFNAKFFPRWESRYLVYESLQSLPRTCLAAMWAEGQLYKPKLAARARGRRLGRRLRAEHANLRLT